ncbi:hypothetical protein B0H10DRAFT_1878152 [Mycena sp. CBHHK59/15]|nr:hypothetical protein B0H10DRAFT_1878152 [Mycena sp. CBHHK59/15]
MPEVPATSSSAWNALLRSALTDTIQPKVDRWRSGLDALLVFLGLFSAIVTSFFVQSLSTLQEDQTVRMNELLANLTDIIITISGVPPSNLHFPQPIAFHPDPTDVRLNSYWSLSLILSLSIAALAVACRGFLNMVGWSRFTKASEKLIDIRTRWRASERFLGPTVEFLPQLLVVPVLLFIAGLLDTLFSSVLQLSPLPISILATSGVSLLLISGVAVLLCYSLVDRSLNPGGPPVARLLLRVRTRSLHAPETLSETAPAVYHTVVQTTHDDDDLNQAAAALYSVMQTFAVWPRYGHTSPGLLDAERATFLHLLSPEASTRSNLTAVQVILRIQESNRIRYSAADMSELVPALLQAARRSTLGARSLEGLWASPFIRAMAIVGNAGALAAHYPPVLCFLTSEYVNTQHLPSDSDPSAEYAVRTTTIARVVEVLFTRLREALHDPCAAEDVVVDRILSPPERADASTGNEAIDPGKLIAALLYLPMPRDSTTVTLIMRWLVHTTSPLRVLRAAQAHVAATTAPDVWPTILFFVASVASRVCLALPELSAPEHDALAHLCVAALRKIALFHQFHPQLPALVGTLRALGASRIGPKMRADLRTVRQFVEDDTWRWSVKQRREVLDELKALGENDVQALETIDETDEMASHHKSQVSPSSSSTAPSPIRCLTYDTHAVELA